MRKWPLNFKKQFAQALRTGEKTQTMRPLRKDGRAPTVGDEVRCYVGLRTPHSQMVSRGVVVEVIPATLVLANVGCLMPGHHDSWENFQLFPDDELREIYLRDGFRDYEEMLAWFRAQYGTEGALPLTIIRWKPVEAQP